MIGKGYDGNFTGYNQGNDAIAIGTYAGKVNQGPQSIAIGSNAGGAGQGSGSVAIGLGAGNTNQSPSSVAVGQNAQNSGPNSVGIGYNVDAKLNSIAIGTNTYSASSTITLNATGANIPQSSAQEGAFFVSPVRAAVNASGSSSLLGYNQGTAEISQVAVGTGLSLSGGTLSLSVGGTLVSNVLITATQSPYTIPDGVRFVRMTLVGGGGCGGRGNYNAAGGGGGGSGYITNTSILNVTNGDTLDVVIGNGAPDQAASGSTIVTYIKAGVPTTIYSAAGGFNGGGPVYSEPLLYQGAGGNGDCGGSTGYSCPAENNGRENTVGSGGTFATNGVVGTVNDGNNTYGGGNANSFNGTFGMPSSWPNIALNTGGGGCGGGYGGGYGSDSSTMNASGYYGGGGAGSSGGGGDIPGGSGAPGCAILSLFF
jgi:hypothetical protein